jgi:LysM domain
MSALPAEPASPLASAEPSPGEARPRLTAVPAGRPVTRPLGRVSVEARRQIPAVPQIPRASVPSSRRSSEHLGRLRLTRRGRVVLIAAATLVASMLGFGLASAAMATDHRIPAPPAHRGLSRVVVQPGQTLWSIAVRTDPSADPRLIEQRIIEFNGLSSSSVAAGQRLWIPQG